EDANGVLRRVAIPQARIARLAYGGDADARRSPPSPEEISRMDEAMLWPSLYAHPSARVTLHVRATLWLRACGTGPSRIARRLDCNRESVRRYWHMGCDQLAERLAQRA